MTSQRVCDGCGATAKSSEADQWARLYVPSRSTWLLGAPTAGVPEHPEFDLCSTCFGQVQSLLTLFDQADGGGA